MCVLDVRAGAEAALAGYPPKAGMTEKESIAKPVAAQRAARDDFGSVTILGLARGRSWMTEIAFPQLTG